MTFVIVTNSSIARSLVVVGRRERSPGYTPPKPPRAQSSGPVRAEGNPYECPEWPCFGFFTLT